MSPEERTGPELPDQAKAAGFCPGTYAFSLALAWAVLDPGALRITNQSFWFSPLREPSRANKPMVATSQVAKEESEEPKKTTQRRRLREREKTRKAATKSSNRWSLPVDCDLASGPECGKKRPWLNRLGPPASSKGEHSDDS